MAPKAGAAGVAAPNAGAAGVAAAPNAGVVVAGAAPKAGAAGVAAAPNENEGALPPAGAAPNAGVGAGAAAPKLKPGCAGFAAAPNEKAMTYKSTERAVVPRYLQADAVACSARGNIGVFGAAADFLVSYRTLATISSAEALGTVTIGQSGQEALGTRLIIARAN